MEYDSEDDQYKDDIPDTIDILDIPDTINELEVDHEHKHEHEYKRELRISFILAHGLYHLYVREKSSSQDIKKYKDIEQEVLSSNGRKSFVNSLSTVDYHTLLYSSLEDVITSQHPQLIDLVSQQYGLSYECVLYYQYRYIQYNQDSINDSVLEYFINKLVDDDRNQYDKVAILNKCLSDACYSASNRDHMDILIGYGASYCANCYNQYHRLLDSNDIQDIQNKQVFEDYFRDHFRDPSLIDRIPDIKSYYQIWIKLNEARSINIKKKHKFENTTDINRYIITKTRFDRNHHISDTPYNQSTDDIGNLIQSMDNGEIWTEMLFTTEEQLISRML
jgi:hypothetical protein